MTISTRPELSANYQGATMQIKPMRNGLVIEPEPDETRVGSIIIPDTAQGKERLAYAIVRVAGRGKHLPDGRVAEMEIQPGARILYRKHKASEPIPNMEPEHRMISEDDVLGEVVG